MSITSVTRARRRKKPGDPSNVLQTYLGEIAQTELLSAEEEQRLAQGVADSRLSIWVSILKQNFFALRIHSTMRDYANRSVVSGLLSGLGGNSESARKKEAALHDLYSFLRTVHPLFAALIRRNAACARGECASDSGAQAVIDEMLTAFDDVGISWRFLDEQIGIVQRKLRTFRRLLAQTKKADSAHRQIVAQRRLSRFLFKHGFTQEQFSRFQQEFSQALALGEEYKNTLIRANTRLVVNIARTYTGKGVALPDLIQEGNIGLLFSAEGFDAGVGRFSTYASYWIKQNIRRSLPDWQRQVHIPAYIINANSKIRRREAQLERKLSDQEVADFLGVKLKTVRLYRLGQPGENSMDTSWNDPNDAPNPKDMLTAPTRSLLDVDKLSAEIEAALGLIDERTMTVLRLRFGLGEVYGETLTLKAIGEQLGITRERVRQIEAEGIAELQRLAPDLELFVES